MLNQIKFNFQILVTLALIFQVTNFSTCYAQLEEEAAKKPASNETTYTAYNIWYENFDRIPSINYKRGSILPAGTVISNIQVSPKKISFFVDEYGLNFTVDFQSKYHPGINPHQFKDRMITNKSLEARLKDKTDVEISGIKSGEIYHGMSKDAVIMAWGYPPEHRTPTTKLPRWVYWTSRFVQKSLAFTDDKLTDFRQ